MPKVALYLISIVLVLFTLFAPLSFLKPFKDRLFQLAIAVLIVGVVALEPFAGLLLGIAAIVGYARVHASLLGPLARRFPGSTESITPFVTAKHLKDAQDNVVSEKEYETPIKGIKGVYGEPVYSAQGTEKSKDILPGRSKEIGSPIMD